MSAKDGWQAMARAMQRHPNGVWRMIGSREARREEIKDIWEAVSDIFIV